MIIDRFVDYTDRDLVITEPTTISSGRYVRTNIVNPEGHEVRFTSGRLRELKANGVAVDSEAAKPTWLIFDGAYYPYGVPEEVPRTLALGVAIVDAIMQRGGVELLESWRKGVEVVLNGPPDMTLADWKAEHIAWTESSGNAIYSGLAFRRAAAFVLQKPLDQVTEADWPALRDTLRQYPLEAWMGGIY